jgi:hypothetical protein
MGYIPGGGVAARGPLCMGSAQWAEPRGSALLAFDRTRGEDGLADLADWLAEPLAWRPDPAFLVPGEGSLRVQKLAPGRAAPRPFQIQASPESQRFWPYTFCQNGCPPVTMPDYEGGGGGLHPPRPCRQPRDRCARRRFSKGFITCFS